MVTRKTRQHRSRLLLVAALVWLVSVTLCSTKITAEIPHGEESHAHQMPGAAHHHTCGEEPCGCASIHAFTAQDLHSSLAKAPAPAGPRFFFLPVDETLPRPSVTIAHRQSTDPPERLSFAEQVLQRCLLSQAPPRFA